MPRVSRKAKTGTMKHRPEDSFILIAATNPYHGSFKPKKPHRLLPISGPFSIAGLPGSRDLISRRLNLLIKAYI
jgi:hypothetical protein